jgi:PAS domain S-box-containing protein
MKIRTKINLSIIISFVVLTMVIVLTIGYFSINLIDSQLKEKIGIINIGYALRINTYLSSQKELVNSLAASQVMRDFLVLPVNSADYQSQQQQVLTRLARSLLASPEISEFYLMDKRGIVVAANDEEETGQDKSEMPIFINGQKVPFISGIYFATDTNEYTYEISAPIIDTKTNELMGVVMAHFSAGYFFETLSNRFGLGQTGENFLVNSDKYLITPSLHLGKQAISKQLIDTQNVRDCFNSTEIGNTVEKGYSSRSALDYIDYNGVSTIGTHSYIPETGWCLITKIDKSELMAPVWQVAFVFLVVLLITIFIFLVIGNFVSRLISLPIEKLNQDAEVIAAGDLNHKIETISHDEIGRLAMSFQKMVESIKKSHAEVDQKVKKQTKEIVVKQQDMADQQKAILNILEDVEEEKENVKKERDKIDIILHSIGDGVFAIDKNLKITLYNQIAAEISGYSIEEAMGQRYDKVLKFVAEDTKKINEKFIKQALSTGQVQEMPSRTVIVRKDGQETAVADSCAPLIEKDGSILGCVVVFRDVTKERQVDKVKTEFVSLASHQLRTPLSAINWYSEMLIAGDAGKLNKEQQKFVEEIYQGNQRMVALVNSLLNVSRLELGTFMVDPKPTNLKKLAEDAINELMPQIKLKQQKFKFTVDPKLPIVSVDTQLTRMIFQNLLSNAIKYTPEKGRISLDISRDKVNFLVKVSDNGYGIPKYQQSKVFQKLFRADNVKAKDTEGTGLGLYIIKSIVDMAQGKVWLESEENKGTTFYAQLPLVGMKKKEGTKTLN